MWELASPILSRHGKLTVQLRCKSCKTAEAPLVHAYSYPDKGHMRQDKVFFIKLEGRGTAIA